MIFFITIMVAQLYTVLHEFTNALLFLRLEETAIGAGCGILVAVAFLPLSTRDTARSAGAAFFFGLADLLERSSDTLDGGGSLVELDGLARALDLKLSQLGQVLRPLTRGGLLSAGHSRQSRHRMTLYAAADVYARGLTATIRRQGVRGGDRAQACRHLAAAARALGAPDRPQEEEPPARGELGNARRVLDRMVDTAAGAPEHLNETLVRLYQVLCELAGTPTDEVGVPTAASSPTPAPAAAQG
jgi:DNA-binding transcriptional ArsR family regulator